MAEPLIIRDPICHAGEFVMYSKGSRDIPKSLNQAFHVLSKIIQQPTHEMGDINFLCRGLVNVSVL